MSDDAKKKMRELAGDEKALPPHLARGDKYLGVSRWLLLIIYISSFWREKLQTQIWIWSFQKEKNTKEIQALSSLEEKVNCTHSIYLELANKLILHFTFINRSVECFCSYCSSILDIMNPIYVYILVSQDFDAFENAVEDEELEKFLCI